MKVRILLYLTVLVAGFVVCHNISQKTYATVKKPTTRPVYTQQALLNILNNERVSVGAKPLKLDPRLNESATLKNEDMDKYGYYDHVNPSTGIHGYSYIHESMPECYRVGENLSHGVVAFKNYEPISDWDKSPTHKAAQLNTDYDLVGFSVKLNKDSFYYYVAHFCQLR